MGVVKVDSAGLTFISTDDSKCLQGTVLFKRQFFKEFWYSGELEESSTSACHYFSVSLTSFVDTLGVFAASGDPSAGMLLQWPNRNAGIDLKLMSESGDEHRPVHACMTAQLGCEEAEPPTDRDSHMTQASSCFIVSTPVLRDVVEDLEWPGGAVTLTLEDHPGRVTLESSVLELGALKVELDLASDRSSGQVVRCIGGRVSHRYKYKHLKIACNVPGNFGPLGGQAPGGQAPNSQVTVDEQGRLKVQHLLRLHNVDQTGEASRFEDEPIVIVSACFTLSPEEILADLDS
eukprot:CAMPEP_0196591034 /NCGR_PEP_ID=MMETSP1081-20130531/68325_1 /TAXON_ID=36882 /ORGANISM="Pyramimonas amylifera, Strain CCMP720" /LENGTH=289 /DNA_ID=CAMNT_0041914285 /DNA_START=190 /DNA_END=1059 /DNA_ORIENTATION=-